MRVRLGLVVLLAGFCAALPLAQAAPATAPATAPVDGKERFLRFVDLGAAGGRLETADAVYVNPQGTVVRLVSAVHVGERSYFQGLQESFRARDAVLYELVKPKEAGPPEPNQVSGSGVSDFQRMLKDVLNLSFQLDEIDYSTPNFVHADLDAETFQKMQAERGESMMTLMLQNLMKAMTRPAPVDAAQDPQAAMEELVRVITRPDSERRMKLVVAKNLAQMEAQGLGFEGETVILTERNKAAIAVLERVLKEGKKDVAIFYGAAHMPDLSSRLTAMGFKQVATEWRMAWDLTLRADQPSLVEEALMEMIRAMSQN